ncbi:MAG: hypothetical protein KKD31_04165 [Bacteroidetes bacterium]|nr:hypothetical protein [Bacteroidota bacterium]
MKKFGLILISIAIAGMVYSQDDGGDKEIKTLINGDITHGGYFGTVLKVANTAGEDGLWVGGKLVWVINHNFGLGIEGYGLTTSNTLWASSYNGWITKKSIGTGYGGLVIEYSPLSHKVVHLSVPVLIGAGGVGVYDRDEYTMYSEYRNFEAASPYFIVEPGVLAELNVAKFLRIAVGASYRYASGLNLGSYDLSDQDFSGLSYNFAIKFGLF